MRKTSKFLALVLVIFLIAVCSFTLVGCAFNPDTKVENLIVEGDLKVGIISDSQLPPDEKDDNGVYRQNLINALFGLKANEVNMILFAGDIGNNASNYSYDTYIECYRKVYGENFVFAPNSNTKYNKDNPLVQTILGNHDYWGHYDGLLTKESYRKRFEEKLGHSPYTHYVVNGFHFIGASPEQGSPMDNQYNTMTDWLNEQLEIAANDNSDLPIFVTTHNSPKNTVYGSEDWGDKKLYDIFAQYPQVVNISGHLHYSILDERSMWQGDFTAFSTQSVSYTELEEGKANGSIPPNASITPMGEIMEFSNDKIAIKRMNFGLKDSVTGAFGVEEKADMRWELPIPLTKDKFTYTTEQKTSKNQAPTMPTDGSGRSFVENDETYLTFAAGEYDDFVHSYKLVWLGGSKQIETYHFTDFINGISNMAKEVTLQVFYVPKGVYTLKIYAVDSYGKVSNNFITIQNVNVVEYIKYK